MEQLSQLRMQDHELTMRQMVEEIHRGLLNIGQAAAKFEVTRQTVKHWVDKVEREAASAKKKTSDTPLQRSVKRKKAAAAPSADRIIELQMQIHALEQELEASHFKTLYYSTLIKVAEQELGIDIEKKSATKQSGSCS